MTLLRAALIASLANLTATVVIVGVVLLLTGAHPPQG